MNDEQNSTQQDPAQPRPFHLSPEFQAAPHWPAMADDKVISTDDEPWPHARRHDQPVESLRPAAPSQNFSPAPIETEPLFKPDEPPRPIAVEHGKVVNSDMADHGQLQQQSLTEEVAPFVQSPRPAMPEEDQSVRTNQEIDEVEPRQEGEEVKKEAEPQFEQTPPDHADLVTVEEAVEIFRERGLPRHMRTIQKYCSRTTGRALVSYQVPTENGIRYMIERSSIDRFIGDAAQQAPTGKFEPEPAVDHQVEHTSENREQGSAGQDLNDILTHPFVQRLEAQVERLESRNEHLQSRIQNVLIDANERLIELQKANAVAQSENLGTFLLEAERIRRQVDDPAGTAPMNRAGESERQFGKLDV